jgi:SNF2 family DNA or RNA helicase
MELDFNRRLRHVQKEITIEDKQVSTLALANALKASKPVGDRGMSSRHATVKALRYEMVKSMQEVLSPIMIRRTLESRRWDGTKINPNLPNKSVFNFPVRLTEKEHVLLNGELRIVGQTLEGQVFDFEVSDLQPFAQPC